MQSHRNDDGAAAVEYALLAGLIAGVIVLIVTQLGQQAIALFQSVAGAF